MATTKKSPPLKKANHNQGKEGNSFIDSCYDCIPDYQPDPLHPERNPHFKPWDEAKLMMFDFRNELYDATFYGGTIYVTEENLNQLSNGHNLLKFHFCSLGEDSKCIFLAFEFDDCVRDNQGNYVLNPDVNSTQLLISTDAVFRYKPSRSETEIIAPSININNTIDLNKQLKLPNDVKRWKDNLRNNRYFIGHLGTCPLSTIDPSVALAGAFNFAASVGEIFIIASSQNKTCAGIRYYFGYDSDSPSGNNIRVILVGVEASGKNIPGTSKENSRPKILTRPMKKP